MKTLHEEFVAQAIYRLDENTAKITKCMALMEEKDIWARPNVYSNSLGNLLLHLCGNITQYILSSLGETSDSRRRDEEFSMTSGYTSKELLVMLSGTIQAAKKIISECTGEQLMANRRVQGFIYSGAGIILHVVEHYSYHTGQIAFWTKLMKARDLGLYEGVDLNALNE